MKAAICTRYGPPNVIDIRDIKKPEASAEEVVVKVKACCVNSGDSRIRALRVPAGMKSMVRLGFGILRPRQPVLGTDFAGIVESVGEGVSRFVPGDEVFGSLGMATGTHAEYVAVPEARAIAKKPGPLSMAESASLVFGGLTALHFLGEKAALQSGENILINGATGSVGAAAIQIAKYLGATVTAVCSAGNAELSRLLGADHVIDYQNEDFALRPQRYDVIMDNIGNAPWKRSKQVLSSDGRLILVATDLPGTIGGLLRPFRAGRKVFVGVAQDTPIAIEQLAKLANSDDISPVIDRVLPFSEIVAAYALVDAGRKQGSVVLEL